MQEYQFALNDELEVFPNSISLDSNIIYHGTSSYYSEDIELNGLINSFNPFNLVAIDELVAIIKRLPFDKSNQASNPFGFTKSEMLAQYFKSKMLASSKISFSHLSSYSLIFASGENMGGQILSNIVNAERAIQDYNAQIDEDKITISTGLEELFEKIHGIKSAKGVIYAIKLPENMNGLTQGTFSIYSSNNIAIQNIVGKVLIPAEFTLTSDVTTLIKNRNKQKFVLNRKLVMLPQN